MTETATAPEEELPARSRKKSLNACLTCRRRHIRCDNSHPACRNCVKHSRDCSYGSSPGNGGKMASIPRSSSYSDEVASADEAITQSMNGSQGTAENSTVEVLSPSGLSYDALHMPQHHLFYHMSSIAKSIEASQANNVAIYMKRLPIFLNIAFSYDFVMYSLIAWAASHLAFLTNSFNAHTTARHFRLLSMQGLQEQIPTFSEKNADAVLSASLLLSWQAANPREWAVFNKGTSAIITAMEPWGANSLFAEYIEEDAMYRQSPSAITGRLNFLSDSNEEAALRYIYEALHRVEQYCHGQAEETLIVQRLMAFVAKVQKHTPIEDPSQRFYLLEPARSMLFWYPAQLLEKSKSDPVAMVVLAHLFAISLTVQPVFAGPGAAHFRGLSTTPIEELYQRLTDRHVADGRTMTSFVPLSLMYFPMQAVALFKSRMGLDQTAVDADQSLTAIRYGLDPLADTVNEVSIEE